MSAMTPRAYIALLRRARLQWPRWWRGGPNKGEIALVITTRLGLAQGNRNKEQGSSTTLRTDTMGVAGFVCDAKLNGPEGTVSWQAPSLIK